jgi:RHS repeat-associated protein
MFFTATFGSATSNGNTIIVGVTYGNADQTLSVTDSEGNVFTQAVKTYDASHNQGCAIFYATNIAGGVRDTIAVNFTSLEAYLALGVHEYSGVAPSSALDVVSGNLGEGNILTSDPGNGPVTTRGGDLIFGVGVEDEVGSGDTFTAGGGFTKRADLGNAAAYADEDQVQSSAGRTAATWTMAPPGLEWIAVMAAFKPATSPSPEITSLLPTSGTIGTSVTIYGSNFGVTQGTSTVTFNGTAATPASWGATSIVVPVPGGATTGNVVATVGGVPSNRVSFTVGGVATVSEVQQASNSDEWSSFYTSFSATFNSNTANGNAIIVAFTFGVEAAPDGSMDNGVTSPSITVTDTYGNTYAQAVRTYDPRHFQGCAIFYATNIIGGASDQVTVNFSDIVAHLALGIHEYRGVAVSSALDAAYGNLGTDSSLTSGSVTPSAGGDLIFGAAVEDTNSDGDTFTPGSGFTKLVDLGIVAAFADEGEVQGQASSIATTWTLSPAGLDWIATIAAFKPASATGGGAGPSITSLSPTSGTVGTSVTINGNNFGATQGTSTVTFNGTAATPTSWDDSSVMVAVPTAATTGNVVVSVSGAASNGVNFTVLTPQPPIVSAGPNQSVELPVNSTTLQGSVTPGWSGGNPTSLWTQVSGPSTATFNAPTSPVTAVTLPVVGTYILKLTGTDGTLTSSATVTAVLAPVNQPPTVTVGPDQTITYPTNTANLTGSVTDDGYPLGSTLRISWSKVVGPGTVTFMNASQPNTQASFSLPGNYVLQLSGNDGQYVSSASMRVAYVSLSTGGLSVSAGPDQVIVFPTAATLTGTATDTNPSPGEVIAVGWSEISGPGTVTFANAAALATTVTFSAPGVYDLRLTATNGIFTASSDVKIYSGNVQCTLSNKGTDFWLMFTGALYQETASTSPDPPRQLQFFISSDVTTSGTVSVPGQGLNQPFNVTPGQITTVNLPQSVQVTSSDTIEAKGIHVTAQNPVAVYGLNFVPYATDGYLGLPTTTLGTSYLIASYENTYYGGVGSAFGTEFGVTATQDNTTVTVVPTASSGNRQANTPFTIQLNQGQTYQLRNSSEYTQLGQYDGPPIDFTGTVVSSDKPVAVFGAHDCSFVPDQTVYCNSLVEQMPPTNLWGQNFVTMPLAEERKGDRFRFIAQTDGTHLQVNHQQAAVLDKGQFFEQLIQGPAEISADNPILTVQYAQSDSAGGGGNVDPTMIVVPPFEQFGGSYTINTPTSGWFPTNYINVIAPTSAVQSGGVLLDGAPLPAVAFQPIGTSPFSGAQIQATVGAHTLTAGLPFGVWVYGFKLTDAYGYTGGVCLAKGVVGSTVTASPKSSTNPITSQVTVQATVLDSSANPIGGTGVTFTIAGINPQTSSGTTNANGVAAFTYTSLKTGSDLITITAGSASDTAGVTWVSNGPNQPPIVNAGPNQTISLPANTVFLNGSVVDDGLPIGGTLTSLWTQLSGPAPVSFGTPNQPQTQVTFSQAGTYVLQLTGNDSQLSTSATVTVVVYPPNQPPVVNPGPDQTIVYPAQTIITFNGTVTDDGLPVGNPLTISWSEFSGPDVATIYSPTSASTAVSFPVPGTYVLQLSASDGQYTTTKSVNAYVLSVVVQTPATASGLINTPIPVQGTITANGQPLPAGLVNSFWSLFSGPTGVAYTAYLTNPGSLSTTFQTNTPGTYQVGLCAGTGANCGLITVYVTSTVPGTPTVAIATPADGVQVTAPTNITGSVSDGSWTLAYGLKDDFNPITFTTLGTGSGAVTNAKLATLDPTLLLNGIYVLQLSTINAGGLTASASITVNVARNMKVGVFSLSFNDLTVPVAGIPIQVIRSYDSRDKGQGDFGVGWRLSLANIRVQKSRNLGLNWQQTQTFSGFLPEYCVLATDNKLVTVTFPDGRVFTFQTGGNPSCQLAGEITSGTLSFVEQPGPAGTAGATLTPADGGQFVVDGNAPGAETLLGYDGNTYDPTTFILKTADGTSYTIDQKLGLTAVTDANGNTLTITPNGIVSSTGKSVPFVRDDLGRITSISDLDGNALYYAYSPTGDLGVFTDRASNATGYFYDNSHNLTGILGANGTQLLTNTFDSSGRLTGTKDGNGFSISFSNNVSAQTQTVTDRNGNPTTYVYDSDGNITQVTDALGNVTASTYDASDNKLTETNALGKTSSYTYDGNGNRLTETDPLNHTTTYTYNALNKPLTITDANGHTTTNTYDPNGNLLTTTDANGKTTTNTYSLSGLLLTTKDALGNVTHFGYDIIGNLTSQTDAAGTITSYTYDGNGNRASQSVTRTIAGGVKQTLATSYAYDGNGRLMKTTYPDNSTAQTVYNSLGQQSTTIDALGRQTTYQYDADGHVTLTAYPDNTTENSVYDKNGNRTQFSDRTGVQTAYTYDALNRLTQSERGSGSVAINKTSYDAIGQVLTTTDPDNNVTQYAYDSAGRRTQVTNALSQVTTFGYDAAGNQTSVKDANNNTTTYTYDNANRRTQVTYPDGKFETTAYDALGRVTARTDAKGLTTQYGYDPLGRLTSVTDALGQITSYVYDEVGDRISQTDANSHTTTYAYDQRGRRVQRTLPLGQMESYTYDAAGNVLTRTDFNGKTTTYTYDAANRLLSKTPDASFGAPAVTYTYTPYGQRYTMTDPCGTTYYGYDTLGRLTQKIIQSNMLLYSYDLASNLTRLSAPTVIVNYTYDALNRLSTVAETNTGTTSYGYDNVGNLLTVTYPNGVVHGYTYDTRNRLTNLGVNKATAIASYAYTLDASGHRTAVAELSGRTVNYGYDNLYRLTNETIASDPNNVNGAASYVYDPVGNRTQKTSTIPGYPGGLSNYNANDQLSTDTYDANGNTTASVGLGYGYDFENHLIRAGAGITMVYDGDGNRVSKTVAGVTTKYLVDTQSPTGYAQVVSEAITGNTTQPYDSARAYVYGLELVSEYRQFVANNQSGTQISYYVYDGHGSVRALTNPGGAVTDTYDYDAFGNLIHSTGTTPNNYLFAGEQFDPDLGLYYNRARYLNTSTGRFWSMDSFEGQRGEPLSLHKYLYGSADPVNRKDPSGHDDLLSFSMGEAGGNIIQAMTTVNRVIVQFLVRRILTVSAFLGAGFFVSSNPNFDVEVQAGGQEAITAVQNAFMDAETAVTEVQAEEGSIWNNYDSLRAYYNELFTGSRGFNPPNIRYHHIVEQAEEEINDFAPNAINSTANVVPTPAGVHDRISDFYQEARPWLDGQSVRGWMQYQSWDVQWREGLEIWKQAMTGDITWRPPM